MAFDTQQIAQITHDACAMFGLELMRAERPDGPLELVATIDIAGEWSGTVAMGCSQAFAQRLASAIFELERSDLSSDDVNDAFGELVNVAVGHIKALLPAGCRMGLPTVESSVRLDAPGPSVAESWGFESDGDPLAVVVQPDVAQPSRVAIR